MIRRLLLASATLLAFVLVVPVAAQAQSIFVLAGAGFLSSDHLEFDAGLFTAGGVAFDIGDSGLWAGAEVSYGTSNIPDQTDSDGDVWTNSDAKLKQLGIMGFLGYSFSTAGNVSPYVFAGAGSINVDFSGMADINGFTLDTGDFGSESEFGYQVGGGLTLGNEESKVRPFVEARYEGVGGEVDATIVAASLGASIGLGN